MTRSLSKITFFARSPWRIRDAILCFDAVGQVSYLSAVRRSFFSGGHRHAGEVLEKDSSGAGVNTADKTTRGEALTGAEEWCATGNHSLKPHTSRAALSGRGPLERVKTTWRRALGEDELSSPSSRRANSPRTHRRNLEFDRFINLKSATRL